MHIADGFLPPNICIAGYAITGGMTWYSLRQINKQNNPREHMTKASLLAAAFFVISSIHIPLPPSSIHLVLNGLMGVLLGYYAFFAILIGLFLQAVMWNHGGLTTLGVNGALLGIPALLAYYIFQLSYRLRQPIWKQVFAFLAGAGGFGITAITFTLLIITTIPADIDAQMEKTAIYASMVGYSIQMGIEGTFTTMLVSFLQRVKPELVP
ncbi:MAG: cobalt transporter CbiM [Prochloron sp. SP5CPC1]|nr:cobalt transporter CbiM [Candidatus Paraprochloron terpiosi SP5CPC1]